MPRTNPDDLRLVWSGRWSVTSRILAVNILALALLAGGFFYLDSYRAQLVDARLGEAATEASLISGALAATPDAERGPLLARLGAVTGARLRVYHGEAAPFDSWSLSRPTYVLRDPTQEEWQRRAARFLDRLIDRVVGAVQPDPFVEPRRDRLAAWPEALAASAGGGEPSPGCAAHPNARR